MKKILSLFLLSLLFTCSVLFAVNGDPTDPGWSGKNVENATLNSTKTALNREIVNTAENPVYIYNVAGALDGYTASNDTTLAKQDSTALVTEYAIEKYIKHELIKAKGYIEFSFMARQSGTDDPIYTILVDDYYTLYGDSIGFTAITERSSIGFYSVDLYPMPNTQFNVFVSNANPSIYGTGFNKVSVVSNSTAMPSPELYIYTYDNDDNLADGILSNDAGIVVTMAFPLPNGF